jgi:predicted AAA+ superfamily ATPase
MLKRKIQKTLQNYFSLGSNKVLLLDGARQIGKSFIIRYEGQKFFKNYIEINFLEDKNGEKLFSNISSTKDFYLKLSVYAGEKMGSKENTLVFLDEIQAYPELLTLLKFLKDENRFTYIASGSLLGVTLNQTLSKPGGRIQKIKMFPLDFEEFLWANGINNKVIDSVKSCFEKETVVPEGIHNAMMELLYRYVIVGGLPEVVNTFLETKNIELIYQLQRNLIAEYEEDMIKYADNSDKVRIRECFESIPKQLAKENKKFQYSVVRKGGRSSQYIGSIQWLEDAGLVKRCYNTQITELPLEGNAIKDCFKLYTTDIGLFVAMLDYGTQADILKGNLLAYKGSIFENLIADFLCKSGQKLYYFQKDSGLELDFLVRYKGECVVIEVKAKSGKTKSLKTVLKNKNIYHVNHAIKLGKYNIGREEEMLTIPLYMGFLIQDTLSDVIVPDIDLRIL